MRNKAFPVECFDKKKEGDRFWRLLPEGSQISYVSVQNIHCRALLLWGQILEFFCQLVAEIFLPGGQLVPEDIVCRNVQRADDFDEDIHTGHFQAPLDFAEIHFTDPGIRCQTVLRHSDF